MKSAIKTLCTTILLRLVRNGEIVFNAAIRKKLSKKMGAILTTVITVNFLDFETLARKSGLGIKNELPKTRLSVGLVCN